MFKTKNEKFEISVENNKKNNLKILAKNDVDELTVFLYGISSLTQ